MGNLIPKDLRDHYAPPLEARATRLSPAKRAEAHASLLAARDQLDREMADIDAAYEAASAHAHDARETAARLELRRRDVAAALLKEGETDAAAVSRQAEAARRRGAKAAAELRRCEESGVANASRRRRGGAARAQWLISP